MLEVNLHDFSWKELNPEGTPPSKRHKHTATLVNNQIWILGGNLGEKKILTMTDEGCNVEVIPGEKV